MVTKPEETALPLAVQSLALDPGYSLAADAAVYAQQPRDRYDTNYFSSCMLLLGVTSVFLVAGYLAVGPIFRLIEDLVGKAPAQSFNWVVGFAWIFGCPLGAMAATKKAIAMMWPPSPTATLAVDENRVVLALPVDTGTKVTPRIMDTAQGGFVVDSTTSNSVVVSLADNSKVEVPRYWRLTSAAPGRLFQGQAGLGEEKELTVEAGRFVLRAPVAVE